MSLIALHIRNVVLIEQLSLEFPDGLSALTGETGAGKSILLDSLGLALGARADAGLVRRGQDQASVTAEFHINDTAHPVRGLLEEQGFFSPDTLILRRTLGSDGRSRAFVNDMSVSIGFLKKIGDSLVDIHGQFETYGLLDPSTHRAVLDQYAGHRNLLDDVAEAHRVWRESERELTECRNQAARALENESYLRDCVDELQMLAPDAGEELSLIEKKKIIQNVAEIHECFSFVENALAGDAGADMQIGQAWRMLDRNIEKIGGWDDVSGLLDDLIRASDAVQEACRKLDRLATSLDLENLDIETVEDRLYALRAAARKHRCGIDDLPALLEDMAQRLALADRQDDMLKELEAKVAQNKGRYRAHAQSLHDSRKYAGQNLDKIINSELKPLKLDKSLFETSVKICHSENAWGVQGFDDVRFLVATNASSDISSKTGLDFGPLDKIASGGEMARFMLALKVVLADSLPYGGVFVFDEIDTGIGGATANAVGERLSRLADRHQVMVVTHSPQVAALARHHWMVSKADGVTKVAPLGKGARQEEIARMLSGAEITGEARAAAARLLDVG